MTKMEYEGVTFENEDFSDNDLSGILFIECTFKGCNLSNAILRKTTFREVSFSDCKMLGLHFEDCTPFFVPPVFNHCQLNLSTFTECKLPGISFRNCILEEVDFTSADLSGANFDGCDLQKAVFEHTDLSKADLRHAFHYLIDPTRNKVKKARFSLEGTPGLLAYFGVVID
jgi:uncharacterized protein YjbI with pentapeptide repeats